jgi:hypothetical protein
MRPNCRSASPASLGVLELQMVAPAPQKSSQAPARHRLCVRLC